jgi:cell division septum initiation protein DivIVA
MEIGAKMERHARGETAERVTDKDARRFVENLIDVTMRFLAPEQVDAFLADLEARLNVGPRL